MVITQGHWGLSPDMQEDQWQLRLDLDRFYATCPRRGPDTYADFPSSFRPRDVMTRQFDHDWLDELVEGYPAIPGSVGKARQRYYIILWSLCQNED